MGREAGGDRLTTWAAIGAYIGRDARSAKRYESDRGLPVHRLPGGGKSTVYAFRAELDRWLRDRAEAPPAAPEPEASVDRLPPPAGPAPASPEAPSARRRIWRRRPRLLAGAAFLALALLIAGIAAVRPPPHVDRAAVIVAALQNDTGEAVFDRLIPRLLQIDLTQSPRLQVAGEARVAQALALMERPRDAVLTPALAREVCARGNGGVVLAPGAARLGGRYVLTAIASDCVSGRILADGREVVSARDAVPQALDRLAARTRRRLGESQASVARFDVPLQAARTASFDALRAYSEAVWLSERGQDVEAVPLFRRAIELDDRFGLAWLGLAQTYYHARQWREDAEAMTHAYALRATLSERDGLFTAYRYHYVVEKDVTAALESLKALALLYPHDPAILNSLSFLQFDLGENDDAIATAGQAMAADPRSPIPRTRLMLPLIRSGRLARARAEGDAAAKAGVMDSRLNETRIMAAALGGDEAGARRLLEAAVGTPSERDALLQFASVTFGSGHARAFDALVDRADALGRRQGVRMDWAAVAAALADMGADERARRRLALVQPDMRVMRFHRAQALVGDPAQAAADLARDEARWPKDTLRNAEYAPEARAVLLLRRGDARGAVRTLSGVDPYLFRTLELPYLRATALLAAGEGAAAADAFRAVLAHPGWANWPQFSLAHLGLARALRRQGDVAGSRREYDAFLWCWRDADADLPQPAQARAERARL